MGVNIELYERNNKDCQERKSFNMGNKEIKILCCSDEVTFKE